MWATGKAEIQRYPQKFIARQVKTSNIHTCKKLVHQNDLQYLPRNPFSATTSAKSLSLVCFRGGGFVLCISMNASIHKLHSSVAKSIRRIMSLIHCSCWHFVRGGGGMQLLGGWHLTSLQENMNYFRRLTLLWVVSSLTNYAYSKLPISKLLLQWSTLKHTLKSKNEHKT